MPDTLDTLQRDLACPACGYNLRGLRGPEVACPECGHACNLVELISRRWTKPWYTAPFFNQLLFPVTWMTLGGLLGFCAGVFGAAAGGMRGAALSATAAAVVLGVWGALLAWVWRRWPGAEGVALSLLAHAILAAYLGGLYGAIALVVTLFVGGAAAKLAALVGIAACAAAVYAGRRGERYIAQRCIRRYLARG